MGLKSVLLNGTPMRHAEDATGHALLDHLHGRRAYEIIELDSGEPSGRGDVSKYFEDEQQFRPHHREAMGLVRGRVLDVACGAGRFALPLQQRGVDVVGIDISPRAIEVCRLRGLRQAHVRDLRVLNDSLGRFDTILMLGNTFGLLGPAEQSRQILRVMHTITSDTGIILAQSDGRRMSGEPTLPACFNMRVRYESYATPWFPFFMATQAQMAALLIGTGWRIGRVIDPSVGVYIAVLAKEQRAADQRTGEPQG